MKINFNDEQTIKLIEKALGFTLYRWQRRYLCLDDMKLNPDYRCVGNSTIYIVKQLLTLDKNLNLKWSLNDIELLIDHNPKSNNMKKMMKPMIENIDYKLKSVGFETCLVEKNETISINERGTTLNEMELVFKMGQLALEVQENERKSYELDTPYYELGNIVKQAYKDMYSVFKGYYHE